MRVEAFSPQGKSWHDVQQAAQAAEEAGFDNFASPEIAHDPFFPLVAASMATKRIGLRTAIAVAFPRSPMVVANICWDLQEQSGGRFTLGVGTQVRAHNERRFSVPWSKPRKRLREYVESLRAIWRCWQKGERLKYEGEFYNFTLMTPEFTPDAAKHPPTPVYTAAVRPRMLELSGEVFDGVRLHGFATRRYLEEVAMPAIEAGLTTAGRARESFDVCGGGFICTGIDDEAVAKQLEFIRYRVAFYGSTPSYQPVFDLHGWQDLGAKLNRMSREGKWKEMAAQVPDEVVHEFAAVAPYDRLKDALQARFGGISDSIELAFDEQTAPGFQQEILKDIKTVEATCKGPNTSWDAL